MLKRQYPSKWLHLLMLFGLLIIVAMLMVAMRNCSHRKGDNPFRSHVVRASGDTLNVAIELNPSVFRVQGGDTTGRDFEILRRISLEHGIPIKYHPFVPLSHAIDGLERGTFDIIVASLPLTTDLKEQFLMTDPVYLDREVLVQRIDSATMPVKTQMELGGDTVWITDNSPFRTRLHNLSAEIGDTIYVMSSPEYSAEALFILTARDLIKYAVINEGIASELAPDFPAVDISTPVSFTQFQSWALAKGDSLLLDSINSWIGQVK